MFKKYVFAVLLIASFVLSACGGGAATAPTAAPATAAPEATKAPAAEPTAAAPASKYSEAPMLAEMVKAGTLPPVEERLPDEPFVVGPGTYMTEEDLPDWTPGKYGGMINAAHNGTFAPDIFVAADEPLLQAAKIGVQNIQGNIVKDFKVENGNKDFTFTMRKGLKWSDGEPVTSEDVRFTWEDIYLNEKITPIFPSRFRVGYRADGEPGTLTIIDEYTFKVSFPEAYGGFLRALTIESWVGYTELINPSHYLKKYHTKYTDIAELKDELARLNLTDEWWQVFTDKRCTNWDMTNIKCADYPGLYPWIEKKTDNASLVAFERNPYYYKVDTQGQQLPYIDKLQSTQVESVEVVNMKVLTGEVDFLRESTALVKIPLYKEAEEKAGFRVQLLEMHVDSSGFMINQTFDDANWMELAQDVRFRQAVSLAINRQEIIDSIYYGYASLPLDTVGEEFSQYDVDKANALMDEMGYTDKDADGYRKYKDGTTIAILLEQGAQAADITPVSDLMAQYLKEIGVKVTVKGIDSSLWGQKNGAGNQLQTTVMWSHDVGWDNDLTTGSISRAGGAWESWRTTLGANGTEPPAWVKEAIDMDTAKWQSVSGSDEYNALVEKGKEWCRTNLPYVNIVEHVKYPLIVNKDLKNVPSAGYAIAGNFSIVQMYFDN